MERLRRYLEVNVTDRGVLDCDLIAIKKIVREETIKKKAYAKSLCKKTIIVDGIKYRYSPFYGRYYPDKT